MIMKVTMIMKMKIIKANISVKMTQKKGEVPRPLPYSSVCDLWDLRSVLCYPGHRVGQAPVCVG